MTDQEHADAIREAAGALRDRIAEATANGLQVDATYVGMSVAGDEPVPVFKFTIARFIRAQVP